jgi:phage terminase large subunit-like protein
MLANDLEMRELKLQKLKELERQKMLPHLYGYPWYSWAWDFVQSRNKVSLLTAANQVSKSSSQIRKLNKWCTEKELWPELWPTENWELKRGPVIWYLYPDATLATTEFEDKWVSEFMPRGIMKDDPKYGWTAHYDSRKKISYIDYNSGARVYFKFYSQDVHSLQGSTVHAIFCDEELPYLLYSELYFRLNSTNGYFNMVFTATRAQEFWREAMEEIGSPFERFKGAWKRSVSLYECQKYMDGTPTKWTPERIAQTVEACADENEVERRVMGRFVRSDGRRYVFTKKKNYIIPGSEDWKHTPPSNWFVFSGVDIGSGSATGAPSAIYFIAVRPDMKYARIFRGWRGDHTPTTAGDTFNKYMELKGDLKVLIASYDYGSADFGLIAANNNEPFNRAIKDRTKGDDILNTLFKFQMLVIDDVGDPELEKLANEWSNLGKDTTVGDDAADSARYGVVPIPFDLKEIRKDLVQEQKIEKMSQLDQRRGGFVTDVPQVEYFDSAQEELAEWDMYHA